MQTLLIADCSEARVAALTEALQSTLKIDACSDGDTALELLTVLQPDILVLNLQLPYRDGLTVLQESPYQPRHIIALVTYSTPYIERCVEAYGISYLMVMPSTGALKTRILDAAQALELYAQKKDAAGVSAAHLHILSFQPHMDGYQQLCLAIPLFSQDPHQRLSKELYPAVAQLCGEKDARSVEHSIRNAIHSAWKHRTDAIWQRYFPADGKGKIPCPSNKLFISRLAQMLQE